MIANDNIIHVLNDLNQIKSTNSKLTEEYVRILEESWTVNSALTNAYSTSSGLLSEPFEIVTYRDLNNSYSDYCKEEKEKEQKERVDNIMNKYGLI